jgi:hypothetical protein
MEKIGKFSLHNAGAFVARIRILFVNENGELEKAKASGDILNNGKRRYFDPKDYGIVDGSVVYLDVLVSAGSDCSAGTPFIYEHGNVITANYRVSGTTLFNSLKLQGVG